MFVPELPEIHNLARQMADELMGREFAGVRVRQPKCLNVDEGEFRAAVCAATVQGITAHGKWLVMHLPGGRMLSNLGMGADVLVRPEAAGDGDAHVVFSFTDGGLLTLRFWWFGHVHWVGEGEPHAPTDSLGPDALSLSEEEFLRLLGNRRAGIKSFLVNQKNLAGIGNVYIQDILFAVGLHPERRIPDIDEETRRLLYREMRDTLRQSLSVGGLAYERDLYGSPGGFAEFCVGYREGEDCPGCGTEIEKMRAAGTASYICPACQV